MDRKVLNLEENITKQEFFTRLIVFFVGIIILSFGLSMVMEANLGVSGWDVLHIGLKETFGLTVGTWSQIVGIAVIIITFFIDKKILSIGTILNMIFVGFFIDLFLYLLPTMNYWLYQYLFLFIGLLIMGIGVGLYIKANLGPGPRDSLMMVLSRKYNWSITKVKTTMELLVLVIGWFLGGPVFVGTIIISLSIGPIIQVSLRFWGKILDPLYAHTRQMAVKRNFNN